MPRMADLIEKARNYLEARGGERTTLAELARAVGASPFHLQRRFKARLGVSPQAFQEALRMERMKSSLRGGARVTEAVFDAGYGSLSRFYEKAAAQLGMRASAYRAKGRGLAIAWTVFDSPLGKILLAASSAGLCSVKIGASANELRAMLNDEFSEAQLTENARPLAGARKRVLAFLAGEDSLVRVPLDIRGTVFQRKVWEALRAIPRGRTRTYSDIAKAIGAPRAVRAVGSACGANPVALVIPCHRAVRADGGMGGYAWGLARKERLLELEKRARR